MNKTNDRKAKIIRYTGYLLTTIFVVLGAIILFKFALGYSYDPKTGEIVSRGLFIFRSRPVNASLYIDDRKKPQSLPLETTLPKGSHQLTLKAKGYRDWSDNLTSVGEDIVWVNYPFLVPNEIKTVEQASLPMADAEGTSLDRKIVLQALTTDGAATLNSVKIDRDKTAQSTVQLPENVIENLREFIAQDVQLAPNGRYAMIKYTFAAEQTTKHLFIDIRSPENSTILEDTFARTIDNFEFSPDNNQDVYILSNAELFMINLNNDTSSAVIARDVTQLSARDYITITRQTAEDAPYEVYRVKDTELEKAPIAYFPNDESVNDVQAVEYKKRKVVLIATSKKSQVKINFDTENPTVVELPIIGQEILMSPANRHGLITDGKNHYQSYDVEFDKKYEFELAKQVSDLSWFDSWHLSAIEEDKKAVMFEFAGKNFQTLFEAKGLNKVFLDGRLESVYGLVSTEAQEVTTSSVSDPALNKPATQTLLRGLLKIK